MSEGRTSQLWDAYKKNELQYRTCQSHYGGAKTQYFGILDENIALLTDSSLNTVAQDEENLGTPQWSISTSCSDAGGEAYHGLNSTG